MAEEDIYRVDQEASPRSTILVASGCMATGNVLPAMMNDVVADISSGDGKVRPATKNKDVETKSSSTADSDTQAQKGTGKESRDGSPPTPISHEYASRLHYSTLTPQQGSGYYMSYAAHQQHLIPEPSSPALSFFQPHASADFHIPASGNSFVGMSGGMGNSSLSPLRGPTPTVTMIGSIPPASPLFPRATSVGSVEPSNGQVRGMPNLPYMTSLHVASSGSSNYQTYPSTGVTSHSSDEGNWNGAGDPRYE
jgi:hypothetical protein